MKAYTVITLLLGMCACFADTNALITIPPIEDIPVPEISFEPQLIDVEIPRTDEDRFPIRILIHNETNALPYEVNDRRADLASFKATVGKLNRLDPGASVLLKTTTNTSPIFRKKTIALIYDAGLTNISTRVDSGSIRKLKE
jgi:hypothetical protein